MWSRVRLDIDWLDLCAGAARLCSPPPRRPVWSQLDHPAAAFLSVRTAWDLLLQSLELPTGSEVIMSALTIPDMAAIVRANGLTPVPADLAPNGVRPDMASIQRAASPRSRVLLIAELFGEENVAPAPCQAWAREHNLVTVVDRAQAYSGSLELPKWADAALYSFGPIKTATALGGAVTVAADETLLQRMCEREAAYAPVSRSWFAARLAKHALLKALSGPLIYALVARWLRRGGRDMDQALSSAVKNFSPTELLASIRQRSCAPLLCLLERRLRQDFATRTRERRQAALECWGRDESAWMGAADDQHTFWLTAVSVENAEELVQRLREHGFDAVRIRSLAAVEPPESRADISIPHVRAALEKTVFVPCYPAMPLRERERLAARICELGEFSSRRAVVPDRMPVDAATE